MKNGDRVQYRSGLKFIFIGEDPCNSKYGCAVEESQDSKVNTRLKGISRLLIEDLEIIPDPNEWKFILINHYIDKEVIYGSHHEGGDWKYIDTIYK